MEVHHHPDVHHKKKNFKEYFLEFLMIFLAVTMGFFAENIRETIAEHKNAKEYANLLIEDLVIDTTELNETGHVLNLIITSGDSLGNLLSSDVKTVAGGKLYYYEYLSGLRWNFITHDATFQQLKSSGSLRYLGDTSLVKKIMDYEESVQIIYLSQNRFEPEKIENWNLVQKVFNQSYFYSLDSLNIYGLDSTNSIHPNLRKLDSLNTYAINLTFSDARIINFMNNNYSLLTYEKDLLQQVRNWAYNSSRNYRLEVHILDAAKLKAVITMDALKKEYNIKDE